MASKTDIAWAAGLFEGEGCLTQGRIGRDRRPYPHMVVSMTDEDVVRRFHRVVGFGNVTEKKPSPSEHKVQWRWDAAGWECLDRFAALLGPYLGQRRQRRLAELLLSYVPPPPHPNTLTTHCPAGHEYSGGNLITYKDGRRACRQCARAARRRYKVRQREGVA